MKITRDNLVVKFIEFFPQHYEAMMEATHYYDKFQPNIFHTEGSVWTHTMMVMTWIEASKYNEKDKEKLLLIGLLHDIGKPSSQEVKAASENKLIRYSFNGHEGVSTMLAINVLKTFKPIFKLSDKTIKTVLELISLHGVFVGKGCDNEYLKKEFHKADKNGAVRQVDEKLFSQYSPRKYSNVHDEFTDSNCIIMVGLPASGKTTYIKSLPNYKVISRDNEMYNFLFIEKKFAKTNLNSSYSSVYKMIHDDEILKNGFNTYFQRRVNELKKWKNLIVDMTMLSLSSRRKMMNQLGKKNYKAVITLTDYEIIKERAHIRRNDIDNPKDISDFVYQNMMRSFVMPVKEEGFSDIKLIVV